MLNLNSKERMLLQDEKKHEELCIEKYNKYSEMASNPELKNLFSQLSEKEKQHLNTINLMLSGVLPNTNSGQAGKQQNQQSNNQSSNEQKLNYYQSQTDFNNDRMLCQDSLSGEKYVSSTYDTAIFEFRDTNARQILNHIQKEEQEHGEKIYNYMEQYRMY